MIYVLEENWGNVMLGQHGSCRAILITSPLEHHTALQTQGAAAGLMPQGASKHTSFFYRQHPPKKMGKCITPNHVWLWF